MKTEFKGLDDSATTFRPKENKDLKPLFSFCWKVSGCKLAAADFLLCWELWVIVRAVKVWHYTEGELGSPQARIWPILRGDREKEHQNLF